MKGTSRAGALALVATLGCATSPTGRKQLLALPEEEVAQLGASSFQQIKQQMPQSDDPAANAEVRCVADRILRALEDDRPEAGQWEVVVFEDPTPNAFALPGNKIGVHTGILEVARTPDQLAAVIGHEVAHVLAQHGNERLSTNVAAQSGLALAALITGAALSEEQQTQRSLIMAALGAGATLGVLLPYSRAQESEADQVGLDLMAKAGFDPAAAVELWRNMDAAGGGQPPEFLSTHPSHGTRIERITEHLPVAQGYYRRQMATGQAGECPALGAGRG